LKTTRVKINLLCTFIYFRPWNS